MTLDEALHVLVEVHTKPDPYGNPNLSMVVMGAVPEPWHSYEGRYVKAWLTVRQHVYRKRCPNDQPRMP